MHIKWDKSNNVWRCPFCGDSDIVLEEAKNYPQRTYGSDSHTLRLSATPTSDYGNILICHVCGNPLGLPDGVELKRA